MVSRWGRPFVTLLPSGLAAGHAPESVIETLWLYRYPIGFVGEGTPPNRSADPHMAVEIDRGERAHQLLGTVELLGGFR